MAERLVTIGQKTYTFGTDIKTIHVGKDFDEKKKVPITHAEITNDSEKAIQVEVFRKNKRIYIGWIPRRICRIDEEKIGALDTERLVVWIPLWFATRINLDKKLEALS